MKKGPFSYYVRTYGGREGPLNCKHVRTAGGSGVSHQCERSDIDFFD